MALQVVHRDTAFFPCPLSTTLTSAPDAVAGAVLVVATTAGTTGQAGGKEGNAAAGPDAVGVAGIDVFDTGGFTVEGVSKSGEAPRLPLMSRKHLEQ